MTLARRREALKLFLIFFWLVFTVTFAIWWFKFSIDNISTLIQLQPEQMDHWLRQKRMVLWEGSAWLVLLVGGGIALVVLVQKEKRRVRQIREFFASFSHDVKTSLASLRVQAESLTDDMPGSPILDRLIGDTVRLQLQLENSLFLASQDDLSLYIERLRLSQLVERLREQWPAVKIDLEGEATVQGDERALRTILSNLTKNAISHGRATEVRLTAENAGPRMVRVRFSDNGEGFEGSIQELGKLFHRPKANSGSGVGIYISRLLVEKMHGRMHLHADNHGFRVDVEMPGELR
ncbi:MAG: HAMP domain-containing histidine kinase [Bdellovibrionales bacterium]|nr:HAMP domain-containing histidine kinase [Bdellovibrionales bacterium]